MVRLACVLIPALPLQILLRRNPGLKDVPAAVMDSDNPNDPISHVNEIAKALGVSRGMKFSSALSFARGLRTEVVSPEECLRENEELTVALQQYSPDVEPVAENPGVFRMSLSGLDLIWPRITDWALEVSGMLSKKSFFTRLVLGFRGFGVMALALGAQFPGDEYRGGNILICKDLKEERELLRRIPFDRLDPPARALESLTRLGVKTLGDFLELPATGILSRYGKDLHLLHRTASYDIELPIQACMHRKPYLQRIDLEENPEPYISGLVFLIKRALHPLFDRLIKEDLSAASMTVRLILDDNEKSRVQERIRPAEPTCKTSFFTDLARLRLESKGLSAAVRSLEVEVEPVKRAYAQQGLFDIRPRRDLHAGGLALARIRAELGDDAVCRAELKTAHMPEGRFSWKPMERPGDFSPDVENPKKFPRKPCALVRRFFARPLPLFCGRKPAETASREADDFEPVDPPEYFYIPRMETPSPDDSATISKNRKTAKRKIRKRGGPYIVSGGWWRSPVYREYWFVETSSGMLLWIYYDRLKAEWYACGLVE